MIPKLIRSFDIPYMLYKLVSVQEIKGFLWFLIEHEVCSKNKMCVFVAKTFTSKLLKLL